MPHPSPVPDAEALAKPENFPLNRLDAVPTRDAPLGLLPVPTPEEVAGFVTLYQRRYGIPLETSQAQQILSGLMRFLYLTGSPPPPSAQL